MNYKYKPPSLSLIADHFKAAQSLENLSNIVNELNRITKIIHNNFYELREVCHCGALDYHNDLLVIYVKNNAAFYIVNNFVRPIQDVLFANGVYLSKILVKVRPNSVTKPKIKHQLDLQQYHMLERFAEAIGRNDLLKPSLQCDEVDVDNDDSCLIKL